MKALGFHRFHMYRNFRKAGGGGNINYGVRQSTVCHGTFHIPPYFAVIIQYFDYYILKNIKKVAQLSNLRYLCIMKRRILTYGGYFEAFMSTLNEKEQEKIQYGLLLLKTQDRLPKKFIKLIRDGLYELRTEYGGNIFRVFFIFDEGKVVVLFNGFQKKSQKTPPNEIEKALKIMEAYYADKQSSNR